MAIQAKRRELVIQMQAAGGGRSGKVAFLSPAEMKGHENARSPPGAGGSADAGQDVPAVAGPQGTGFGGCRGDRRALAPSAA